MAAWRRAIELSLTDTDTAKLTSIAQSRTEPASRVERARILLAYREDPSFFAVGQALGLHHQTVQRCVERAAAEGPLAALDDRPRPGREPTITIEAKAWLVDLACRKAKDLGYPHELWTTRLLASHARERETRPRTCVPRQPGAGHGVQNPRPRRREAAQSALLFGAPRPRLRGKNGRSTVRLSPSENLEEGGGLEEQAKKRRCLMTLRSPGIQAIATTAPICRQSPACTRPLPASTNTSATAQSVCWLGSILSPAEFTRWSRIATAAANSLSSSSFSTPPIRPEPRSS